MRRLALVLVAVQVLVAGGCGDSTGPQSLVGTYDLRSIDGDPVPVVVVEAEGFRREIVSGFVRLNGDGSFEAMNNYQITTGTDAQTISLIVNGGYERSGNAITLRFLSPQGGPPVTVAAIWANNRLTIDDDGHRWVYER